MADAPLDELLSAYLDGELTADEQDRVDRLLAEDPRAQQLLDDLRGLSGQVQGLPSHRLPADFSDQVLRHAERQMLSNDAVIPVAEADVAQLADAAPASAPWSERVRRPMLYAMLAASVAVLLTVFNPNAPPPRTGSVAMSPAEVADSAPTSKPASDLDWHKNNSSGPNLSAPGIPSEGVSGLERIAGSPATDAAAPSGVASAPSSPGPALPGLRSSMTDDSAGASESVNEYFAHSELANGLLVVQCTVSPTALKNESFQKLLSSQQVEWKYADSVDNQALTPTEQKELGRAASGADQQVAAAAAEVKLLYVEATPDQMEKTLAELAGRPESFPTVTVDPVANVGVQQRWQNAYSRRAPIDRLQRQGPATAEYGAAASEAVPADKKPEDEQIAKRAAPQPAVKESPQAEAPLAGAAPQQKAPSSQQFENALNNTSRARSYSVPRGGYDAPAKNAPAHGTAAQAPGERAQAGQQSPAAARPLAIGAAAGENRLRALFVLQLSPDAFPAASPSAAASTIPATPSDSPGNEAPAAKKDSPDR